MARRATQPFVYGSLGSRGRRALPSGVRLDKPTPVAWLLMFMGLATFAPAVILPEWRSYESLKISEQVERHRLDTLQRVVNRQRRALSALQSDPAVLVRLAKRDLGYREPGTDAVAVAAGSVPPPSRDPFIPAPVPPPAVLRPLLARLPALNYDAIFCDAATRPIMIAMSMALMVSAIWLSAQPFSKTDHEATS